MTSCLPMQVARIADHRATPEATPRAIWPFGGIGRIPHRASDRAGSVFPKSQCYLGVRS
jgi:hypothetical protein